MPAGDGPLLTSPGGVGFWLVGVVSPGEGFGVFSEGPCLFICRVGPLGESAGAVQLRFRLT